MRSLYVLMFLVLLVAAAPVVAAEPAAAWSAPPAVVAADEVENPEGEIRLTRKERRKLGLTFRNVRKTVAELKKAGELDTGDPDGTAVQVLEKIVGDNPKAVQEVVGDRDWASFLDALLKFLEQIMPIILMFFG